MAESRLSPEIDLEGLSPDEAFAVLGNGHRLAIIRELWHAGAAHQFDDVSDTAGSIAYTELRRRVNVDDNGKFNYHLSKLTPHFVRDTASGYRLSGAGRRIARTVVAISGEEAVTFEAELERSCPLCDAPMRIGYEDQWLRVSCTECGGLFGDETPNGTVFQSNYPAAGLRDRTPDEALTTGLYRCLLDLAYLTHGVCRECSGRVSSEISACEDHHPSDDGHCPTCGTAFPVWTELQCQTCSFAKRLPVEMVVLGLTPVIAFLHDQGFDVFSADFDEAIDLLQHQVVTTVASDPFTVTVVFRGDSDTLGVTLDTDLAVVGVD